MTLPHRCAETRCAICAWNRGERWGTIFRPLSFYERFLLSQLSESGRIGRSGSEGVEAPADPCHTTRVLEARRHA